MSRYEHKFNKPITIEEVREVNILSYKNPNNEYIIIFDNTKGLDKNIIRELNPKVQIKIQGGFSPNKEKYKSYNYQERMLYTKDELVDIIDNFEKIEREIDPSFNELERAAYIFRVLAEKMVYYDGDMYSEAPYYRDVLRTYRNIVTKCSVCAGFALLYKEMMDRQGIKCYYVNKIHRHDWNVLEIDGKYIPVDLSDECCHTHRHDHKCHFTSFGNKDFYTIMGGSGRHHEVLDKEEYDFSKCSNLKFFNTEELSDLRNRVTSKRVREISFNNVKYRGIPVKAFLLDFNKDVYNIGINRDNEFFVMSLSYDEFVNISKKKIIPNKPINAMTHYTRKDGSEFYTYPSVNNKNAYMYLEKKDNVYKKTTLLSENNLYKNNNMYNIANYLLSKERVERKINEFNGYVGYIEDGEMFYNRDFEKDYLNIINRK